MLATKSYSPFVFYGRLKWEFEEILNRPRYISVHFFIYQQTDFLLSEYTFEWVVLKFVTQIGSRKDVNYRISLPIVLIFQNYDWIKIDWEMFVLGDVCYAMWDKL